MKLNSDQIRCLDLIAEGRNVFLTGQAGTGKSVTLMRATKWLEDQGKIVGVTSLTGVSALHIKGVTIHSWAGIGKYESKGAKLLEYVCKNRGALKRWKSTDYLVIDEISMMSPDMLDDLDFLGRRLRHSQEPFGGIKIIGCGDFCQLPPVVTDVLCLDAKSWSRIFPDLSKNYVYLQKNERQNDPEFQKMLSRIRLGITTAEDRELLQTRVGVDLNADWESEDLQIEPTKLRSHRKTVDEINRVELAKLKASGEKIKRFKADDRFESQYQLSDYIKECYINSLNKACQTKPVLDIAIGAQVMLVHNVSAESGLVNGSRGVILGFEEGRPKVRFRNGLEVCVPAIEIDFRVNPKIRVIRRQIPLILAYAVTIHKCQGSTLDCVDISLDKTIFADGQFYTALSRVRSLDGLTLSALDFDGVKVHPRAEEFYRQLGELNESK